MTSSPEYDDKLHKPPDAGTRRLAEEPLEPSFQRRVREALGQDPQGVRLHLGPAAQEEASSRGARALTRGQDIYFAREEFDPETEAGQRLLVHELAHTIQQGGAATQPGSRGELEAEADQAAEAVVRGARGRVELQAPRGMVQHQEKGKPAAPILMKHPEEIMPVPGQGTVSGGGMTIPYLYTASSGAPFTTLTLQIPDGISLLVTPLTDLRQGEDYRVQDAGGPRARAVVITVTNKPAGPPKLQLTFNRSTTSYVVVFHFPTASGKK